MHQGPAMEVEDMIPAPRAALPQGKRRTDSLEEEEGPCSTRSGMRAVLGQVYAGGQWGTA